MIDNIDDMVMIDYTLDWWYTISKNNQLLISQTQQVGCFSCISRMASNEVLYNNPKTETAQCPYCQSEHIIPLDHVNGEHNRIRLLHIMHNKFVKN